MIHKILISDRSFNPLVEVQDIASNIRWEYNRIGGCGAFSFDLPIKYCRQILIALGFNVKIYRRNPSTGDYDIWYQGRIENTIHNIQGETEVLTIEGVGYQSALKDIYIDNVTYSSQEASVIISDLLTNYITPNTDITAGTVSATSFTPNSLQFNQDALSCIQTIADIVGTREWGVNASRELYFQQRSSSVGFVYILGNKITSFSLDISSDDIVNRVIVIGADSGGTPFKESYNSTQSQAKWKRRDKVIKNSAVSTSQVAEQLATAQFSELNDVVRRARVDLLEERQIEATIPIPLFQVIPSLIAYGQLKYGTFLYSGKVDMQVNRINYSMDIVGNLSISLQLGQLRPSIAEDISQLEFEINQLVGEAI